jgi:hypothetical protein
MSDVIFPSVRFPLTHSIVSTVEIQRHTMNLMIRRTDTGKVKDNYH